MTEDAQNVSGGVYLVLISCTIAFTIIAYVATQIQTSSVVGQVAVVISLLGVMATMIAATTLGIGWARIKRKT